MLKYKEGKTMPKFFNKLGEQILAEEECAAMSPASLAKALRDYNSHRRGQGKYKWSEDPQKNRPSPYSPATIGFLIDTAAKTLEKI